MVTICHFTGTQLTATTIDARLTASMLFGQGRWDDARRLLGEVLTRSPRDVEAWILLAELDFRQGDLIRALTASGNAARLNPNSPQALDVLGRVHRANADALLAVGRLEDARATLLDALRLAPRDAELQLAAGKLDCAHGRAQSGLERVEEAARLGPEFIEANEIARRICTAAGLYERALRYSDRMLSLAPTEDIAVARRLLLPCIQHSRQSIRETRDRYAQGLALSLNSDAPLTLPSSVVGPTPSRSPHIPPSFSPTTGRTIVSCRCSSRACTSIGYPRWR